MSSTAGRLDALTDRTATLFSKGGQVLRLERPIGPGASATVGPDRRRGSDDEDRGRTGHRLCGAAERGRHPGPERDGRWPAGAGRSVPGQHGHRGRPGRRARARPLAHAGRAADADDGDARPTPGRRPLGAAARSMATTRSRAWPPATTGWPTRWRPATARWPVSRTRSRCSPRARASPDSWPPPSRRPPRPSGSPPSRSACTDPRDPMPRNAPPWPTRRSGSRARPSRSRRRWPSAMTGSAAWSRRRSRRASGARPMPTCCASSASSWRRPSGRAELFGEVESLAELKQEFLRGVSHNLQTPLTSIRGFATQLAEQDPDPRLGIIVEQADRLSRLVAQLLTVSKLEAGTLQPEIDVFPLGPLVQRVWESLGRERAARSTCATARPAGWPPPTATGSSRSSGRCSTTPSSTAARARSRSASTSSRISPTSTPMARPASHREREHGLAATIRDHGPGIAADQRERVFERFTRLQSGGGDGTGLGLSVARGLASAPAATSRWSIPRMAVRAPPSSLPCKLNGSRKPDPTRSLVSPVTVLNTTAVPDRYLRTACRSTRPGPSSALA